MDNPIAICPVCGHDTEHDTERGANIQERIYDHELRKLCSLMDKGKPKFTDGQIAFINSVLWRLTEWESLKGVLTGRERRRAALILDKIERSNVVVGYPDNPQGEN